MTRKEYLRRVGSTLRDLPWSQRRDLLAELGSHLADFPADTDLAERLGPPEQYAADLRAAEGLERRHGPIAYLRARRPRTVLLVVLALMVIGLASGAVAWVESYQPIARGGHFVYPLREGASGLLEQLEGSQTEDVRNGKPAEFGVTFSNNGPFTVRVTGIPTLMQTVPARGALYIYERGDARLRPFHPFDLAPGQTANLVFRGTYNARCNPGGPTEQTILDLTGFRVQFSFLWRSGSAEVTFPAPLIFDYPKGERCDVTR
ncbi:MAG: hypothetical protein QOG85_2291 [Gaiellaceae bacterium]|jgi:hypothetical protein|nr:hypothetical protein [Gaiellaceae bacterium]